MFLSFKTGELCRLNKGLTDNSGKFLAFRRCSVRNYSRTGLDLRVLGVTLTMVALSCDESELELPSFTDRLTKPGILLLDSASE